MIDPDIDDEGGIDASDRLVRQFAALSGLALGAGAARALVRGSATEAGVFTALAAAVAVLGFARPGAVRPVFVAAMAIAAPIRAVVSPLLLGLVYYGVFTPMAVVFRLAGRDALSRRPRQTGTYWTPKAKPDDVRRYFRQS